MSGESCHRPVAVPPLLHRPWCVLCRWLSRRGRGAAPAGLCAQFAGWETSASCGLTEALALAARARCCRPLGSGPTWGRPGDPRLRPRPHYRAAVVRSLAGRLSHISDGPPQTPAQAGPTPRPPGDCSIPPQGCGELHQKPSRCRRGRKSQIRPPRPASVRRNRQAQRGDRHLALGESSRVMPDSSVRPWDHSRNDAAR